MRTGAPESLQAGAASPMLKREPHDDDRGRHRQHPPPNADSGACPRLSDAWVKDERDYDTWFAVNLDEADADDWRRAGFSASEAAAWVAADATYGASSNAGYIRLASAWTAAGFAPEQASEWDDLLAHHRVSDRPMLAREWRTAGFSAGAAKPWIEREDVTTAIALANNGWEPWQRDMLDVLLGHPQEHGTERVGLIESGLAPGNLLDYLRAGVDASEYGRYERLRRQGARRWTPPGGRGSSAWAVLRHRLPHRLDPRLGRTHSG